MRGDIHDNCPGDAENKAESQKIPEIKRVSTVEVVLPVYLSLSKRGAPTQVHPAGCSGRLSIPCCRMSGVFGKYPQHVFVALASIEGNMLFWKVELVPGMSRSWCCATGIWDHLSRRHMEAAARKIHIHDSSGCGKYLPL